MSSTSSAQRTTAKKVAAVILLGAFWISYRAKQSKYHRPRAKSKNHRALPEPSSCPRKGGPVFSRKITHQPVYWIFLGNQLANIPFLTEQYDGKTWTWIGFDPTKQPVISYPVRLKRSAGFYRAFSMGGYRSLGEQTTTGVFPTTLIERDDGQRGLAPASFAHSMVGVLVPVYTTKQPDEGFTTTIHSRDVEWLSWTEKPDLSKILVLSFDYSGDSKQWGNKPPSLKYPILQSHVDMLVEAAIDAYPSDDGCFAKEWMDTTHLWSRHWLNDRPFSRRPWVANKRALRIDDILEKHPPPPRNTFQNRAHTLFVCTTCKNKEKKKSTTVSLPSQPPPPGGDFRAPLARTPPRVVRNFVIGYGSIIQTKSRSASDPSAADAAPVRVKASFGYVREWNFQAATSQICALGLRRTGPDEAGCSFNGVLFPAPNDMSLFDKRENGYRRVHVPRDQVDLLSWQQLPAQANIYIYVPYAPAVVAKYGINPDTGLPFCTGPDPPLGLLPSEEAGLGLCPASTRFPILQSYLDIVLTGCLEYGVDFAQEFIQTTFLWTPFWLNERPLARRPWVHEKQYAYVDQLCATWLPKYFAHRKLVSEYACLFHTACQYS